MSAPPSSTPRRKLRYAMVGGGRDAFIGAVHRHAIALDGQAGRHLPAHTGQLSDLRP